MKGSVPHVLLAVLAWSQQTAGCALDSTEYRSGANIDSIVATNLQARDERTAIVATRSSQKTAIRNIFVFNGHDISGPKTVVMNGDRIGSDAHGARYIDGDGGVLIPGLIDSHVHPMNATELLQLTQHGVTTAFSMACFAPAACQSLQNHPGLVDIRTSTAPAAAAGSTHGNITIAATNDTTLLLSSPEEVPVWMGSQTSWNPDVVKVVAESPGLDEPTLKALALAARQGHKRSVCHAADYKSYRQAVTAGFDMVHHAPLDQPVDKAILNRMFSHRQVSAPTLTMMQAIANRLAPKSYAAANASVGALHAAKIPILAGTDANQLPGVPANVPFGTSLHLELELLVAAGLEPVEALRAATINPARHFGLHDRGTIAPGKRADIVLLGGDPTKNISETKNIKRVWLAGIEYDGTLGI